MKFDEGTCYFVITPSNSNPMLEDLSKFKEKYEWFGAIHPDNYSLIPFQIKFRSMGLKSEEEIERFERLLSMKIDLAWKNIITGVLESGSIQDQYVENWLEIIQGTSLLNSVLKVFLEANYGKVFNSLLQVITSEIIHGFKELEKKFNYSLTLERLQPNAMLLGKFHNETLQDRFVQRLYDENIRVSAYKWDLGISIRKKFLWKKPWSAFLEPHI